MSMLDNIVISKNNVNNIIPKSSAGNNIYLDKNTNITRNGQVLGSMEDVNNGLVPLGACDCPSGLHSDGGMMHAHVLELSGGEYAVKCSGSTCGSGLFVMNKEMELIRADIPFGAVDVEKVEKTKAAVTTISEWLIQNKAHIWFDEDTEKYCLKRKTFVNYFSKSGFQQFFLSSCGVKLKGADIKIEALKSDYRPNKEDFFSDGGINYINSFSASELMSVESKRTEMPELIGRLIDNLFDDKDQMHHFINWMAYIYQKREKTGTCWVFAGKQGTGKGVLVEHIIKGIWKHNAVCNLTDSNLESAFNSYLQDRMFVHFNEISADNKKSRVAVKNRLKTWMTDDTIYINAKGIREVEKANYCNLIMSSNEHIPVDIDAGDRRFNVVRTDNVLTDTSWFVKGETVYQMTKELKQFAEYLNGFDIDKTAARTVMKSTLKEELVEAVKTKAEEIADAFRVKDFEYFLDSGLEYWLDKQDGFNTLKVEELEQIFSEKFIPNNVITTLISAVYGKEVNMMSASKTIFTRFKIGEKHRTINERGYLFS